MSVLMGYIQPQTGLIDILFGGGLVALFLAAVGLSGWAFRKFFVSIENSTVKKGNGRNGSK